MSQLSAAVTRGDFPDPFVCPMASGFIAYGTNSAGFNVQVRTSTDLWTWSPVREAMPEVARWAATGWTWSPAAVISDGGAVLWYVVREPRSGRQVISVAHAAEAVGPFSDRSESPAVAQLELGGSIDPSPFVDVDGTAYLLWKSDANALGRRSSLWAQRLNDERDALVDRAVPLLDHDRRWERPLIEAPSMTTVGGRYWLFYSGGWWESKSYGIGIAVADRPLGPWRKLTRRRPWVTSGELGAGPGGQEVFRDGAGVTYLAYHAWDPARVGYGAGGERSLRIGVLEFGGGELPELRPLTAAPS